MSLYYLTIPIIIGIVVGGFLGTYAINSNDSQIITPTQLIENGSPFLGDLMHRLQYWNGVIISVHFATNSIKRQ